MKGWKVIQTSSRPTPPRNGQQQELDPEPARAGRGQPAPDGLHHQGHVEADDDQRDQPGGGLQPGADGEVRHLPPVRHEVDERDHGEGQLEGEHHLAQHQEATGGVLPEVEDREHRRRHGQEPGDHPPQPGPDPDVQVALHDDLARQGAGDGGALPRGQQGHGEGDGRDGGPDDGLEQPVGVLDLRDAVVAVLVEDRGRHHQDRRVDEEGEVQREGRIQGVQPDGPLGSVLAA